MSRQRHKTPSSNINKYTLSLYCFIDFLLEILRFACEKNRYFHYFLRHLHLKSQCLTRSIHINCKPEFLLIKVFSVLEESDMYALRQFFMPVKRGIGITAIRQYIQVI